MKTILTIFALAALLASPTTAGAEVLRAEVGVSGMF